MIRNNIMKPLFLLLMGASAVFSAPLSLGVKAGVPLTDFFSTVNSPNFGFNSNTKRYLAGPTVELHLPAGFSVELDALYRRFNYESSGSLIDVLTNNRTTGNAWEFPLLLKYNAGHGMVRPFVDGGVSFDTLSGLTQTVTNTIFPNGRTTTSATGNPAELQNSTTTGFVLGGGVDIHVLLLHISPEVRYTRWGSQHFQLNNFLQSSQNQAEFLVGFTF